MLTRRQLLRLVDAPAVEAAIARAESRTSAEIRVALAPFFWGSIRDTAERAFVRLGIGSTRAHNGVLIFLVPSRRGLAVIGDAAIHAVVGAAFWTEVCGRLETSFRAGRYTEGLVAAIELLGIRLGPSFPVDPAGDRNELPNAVVVVDHIAQSSPQPEEVGADPAPGLGPRRATMRT
ncbi:TPM domain-containing protein [Nannocystis sp.]|nr:TPM domain-containing protein [Nannocystis sp.]MBK7827145.1 TPM domain-containing protein [Nannocystis sp.]